MKRIRSEKLIRTKPGVAGAAGFSTVELFALPEAPGHVVHVSTSRDGLQWKETVFTPSPLPFEAASTAFEHAVAAQIAQGYVPEGSAAPAPAATPPTAAAGAGAAEPSGT